MSDQGFAEAFGIEEDFERLYTDAEVVAGSGRTSQFTLADVQLADRRLAAADVLDDLAAWRAEDAADRKPGGAPRRSLDDRHVLIALLLLAKEHSPLWVSEMAKLFWFRLTPDARIYLGIDHLGWEVSDHQQAKNWYNHTSRTLHRLIDVIDPYPAPRQMMNQAERRAVVSLRDKNTIRLKLERSRRFTNSFLEMTWQMLPRDLRRRWKGSVSIDQTMAAAPSRHGIAKTVKGADRADAIVMELDAAWHTRNPDDRGLAKSANEKDSRWSYEVNIAVQVPADSSKRADVPLLAIGATLSRPNEDVGGEAVHILESLVERGHPRGHVTADKGYFANLTPENLWYRVRELGYGVVTDYYKNRLGIQGGQRGAKLVEGAYLCPSTPKALVEANVEYVAKEKKLEQAAVDAGSWKGLGMDRAHLDTRTNLLKEREKYRLRRKEAPSTDGTVKMMCPAYGAGATVTCPLRDVHPKASKKDKPDVLLPPEHPDDICTQHSVTIKIEEESRWLQDLPYKSEEWIERYATDRNTIEGYNAYVKDPGRENMEDPGKRRVRGFAAQQLLITILLVNANMRKVFAFLADESKTEAQKNSRRRRERNHRSLSKYIPRLTVLLEQQEATDRAAAIAAAASDIPLRL